MDKSPSPILLSTLEISGDEYAGYLIEQFKKHDLETPFIGLGGDQAKNAGMRLNAHFKNYPTMALVDTIKKLHVFIALFKTLVKTMDLEKPKAVVLIDSGAFNLRLAKEAYKRNIPVLYLIPPKVWAWASWRLKKIHKYCDKVCCMYDFETTYYKDNKILASTIANPRNKHLLPSTSYIKGLYAICPGSRVREIQYNLPFLLDACILIQKKQSFATFGLVIANQRIKPYILEICKHYPKLSITFIEDKQKSYLSQVDIALATSGTLTYELMMLKKPMVVVYKTTKKLEYYIIKEWFYKPNWVSLPNLIANRTIVPELLQKNMTPENIANEALKLTENTETRTNMVRQLNVLRQQSTNYNNKDLGEILYAFITE